MIPVEHYVVARRVLFTIGGIGFLVRRNVLVTLMSIELMLNAVNLTLVAFNRVHAERRTPARSSRSSSSPSRPPRPRSASRSCCRSSASEATVRSDEADLLKN